MAYLLTAVIKPFKLGDIRTALADLGISGMTVSEVQGFGRQGGHTEAYRGAEYRIDFVPKVKVEILIPADSVDRAVEAVREAAATGKIGDGKIWVTEAQRVVRIRTGEEGDDAL